MLLAILTFPEWGTILTSQSEEVAQAVANNQEV